MGRLTALPDAPSVRRTEMRICLLFLHRSFARPLLIFIFQGGGGGRAGAGRPQPLVYFVFFF